MRISDWSSDVCSSDLEQAVFLQRTAQPQVQFGYTPPPQPLVVPCDGRQVSQALTNLIKNAIESIEGRQQAQGEDAPGGALDVTLGIGAGNCVIEVADNGRGLPDVNRSRLPEPYVTTRHRGTGLGFAIVKQIMADPGTDLVRHDREGRS